MGTSAITSSARHRTASIADAGRGARRRARAFGNIAMITEDTQAVGFRWLDQLLQDTPAPAHAAPGAAFASS
jgi:hypothetical protein